MPVIAGMLFGAVYVVLGMSLMLVLDDRAGGWLERVVGESYLRLIVALLAWPVVVLPLWALAGLRAWRERRARGW